MTEISRVKIIICVNEDSEGQKLTLDGSQKPRILKKGL